MAQRISSYRSADAFGLLAGGTVCRAALEAGARLPARNGPACRTMDRWRCPTDEQPQRPVVRPLLLALCQRLRMDRAKPRTAVRIHHCDHDLRATWRVEHDPIKYGADAGDLHELTYRDHLHQPSLGHPVSVRPLVAARADRPRSVPGEHVACNPSACRSVDGLRTNCHWEPGALRWIIVAISITTSKERS